MSFMEILTMYHKLPKKKDAPGAVMTDEQYEAGKQGWRDLNLPDVKV